MDIDAQLKLQVKFANFVRFLHPKMSSMCSRRLICDMACMDYALKTPNKEYIVATSGTIDVELEIITRAFIIYEQLGCYLNNRGRSPFYCTEFCAEKFSLCLNEITPNSPIYYYLTMSKLFFISRMNVFNIMDKLMQINIVNPVNKTNGKDDDNDNNNNN